MLHNETVSCQICGRTTDNSGTKLCNSCWEMDKGYDRLVGHDCLKALTWLTQQLMELATQIAKKE